MNIALSILLLVMGGLTFWILNESTLKWYIKTVLIASFCFFTVMFYTLIHTFLGWAAQQKDIPDKIAIHWVIVKEPNKLTGFEGKIYILIESVDQKNKNLFLKFFGYKGSSIEPRLHELKYSRGLHEQLSKNVIPKNKKGQPVAGKFLKGEDGGKGKKGNSKNSEKQDGEGSESQGQDWFFHELLPSEIHRKPER
jgi:hypothetical protein